MNKPTESLKAYWRSLEAHDAELAGEATPTSHDEFPTAQSELTQVRVGRRGFVGILGASTALAGLTTGCARKPVEHILPFAKRPEDLIPGKPVWYATAFQHGGSVFGVLAESQDGRPIKIEGNPKHIASQGATDAFAQASVLNLYDGERSQIALKRGEGGAEAVAWEDAKAEIDAILTAARSAGGKGLALVIPWTVSPSIREQIKTFTKNFPQAQIFLDDPTAPVHSTKAIEMLAGAGSRFTTHLDTARVVLACDSDFTGNEQDQVRLAREFAANRSPMSPGDPMSRLYVVEPTLTVTGGCADHRLPMRAGDIGRFLLALLKELVSKHNVKAPQPLVDVAAEGFDEATQAKIAAIAKDLVSARAERSAGVGAERAAGSAVLVGERQPPWVHGVALAINLGLGNGNASIRFRADDTAIAAEDLADLAAGLGKGAITTVLCLGTNPAYDAPGELALADLLAKAQVIHVGTHVDETAKIAAWHLPLSHYLEAWGDVQSSEGTYSICQPLINPLFGTRSALEIMAWWATGNLMNGDDLVRSTWTSLLGDSFSERRWRRWLHDGLVTGIPRVPGVPAPQEWGALVEAVEKGLKAGPEEAFEVNFYLDPKVADGRFANNAWMQELPHPISKLTWDNAAYLSPATARELGVKNCDLVTINIGGREAKLPAWIIPGQADKTVALSVGYGRDELGTVAKGAGVNVYPLQAAKNPWTTTGTVIRAGGQHMIYSTQDHGTLNPGMDYEKRPIVRETTTTASGWAEPEFAKTGDLMKPSDLKSLWEHNTEPTLGEPKLTGKQQWAMVIDLNRCNGCSACVVACQAENNIPVVGKAQVANGREMHWIRMDRYYTGDPKTGMPLDNPEVVFQPMLCQHCETAPCENVCPVAATTHSPEGLNDMAYNRCIGTRYCANNCPYKVRRFNFHNYNRRMEEDMRQDPLIRMVRNPDVTVRFRGVIEKCTYCVQRIQEAKIEAHVAGEDIVADGKIVVACQQACAADAIVFGDKDDPGSRVAKLRANPRNYGVLTDLYTRPRTTYLGRIRNPNPEFV